MDETRGRRPLGGSLSIVLSAIYFLVVFLVLSGALLLVYLALTPTITFSDRISLASRLPFVHINISSSHFTSS